ARVVFDLSEQDAQKFKGKPFQVRLSTELPHDRGTITGTVRITFPIATKTVESARNLGVGGLGAERDTFFQLPKQTGRLTATVTLPKQVLGDRKALSNLTAQLVRPDGKVVTALRGSADMVLSHNISSDDLNAIGATPDRYGSVRLINNGPTPIPGISVVAKFAPK